MESRHCSCSLQAPSGPQLVKIFMRSAAIAALALMPALGACTTNWSEYPWADTEDMCTGEIIGAEVYRTHPPIPSANGTVVAVSGEPLPEGLHYRISFSSDHGAQTMTTRSPAFSLCIENPERKSDYQWFAEVRESATGPILFRSPAPQPFKATAPIVVLVDALPD